MYKIMLLKGTLFLTILALVFCLANFLFQPTFPNEYNYVSKHLFYKEPENTVETLILGTSVSYHGISPMILYRDYGICAYALGTSNQPVLTSYYWLKEAYQRHPNSLKNIILEVSDFVGKKKDLPWYQLNTDAMETFDNRIHAIHDYTNSFQELLICMTPFFSYHERWADGVNKSDSSDDSREEPWLRGAYINYGHRYFDTTPFEELEVPDYYYTSEDIRTIREESMLFFSKIASFCQEKQLKLILVKTPGHSIKSDGHNAVKRIADSYGIDFFDFNAAPYVDEIGYNHATDSYDGIHLNYYGSSKLTHWIGQYLRSECESSDIRNNDAFSFLKKQYYDYQQNVNRQIALMEITDPVELIKYATADSNNITLITVKDDASSKLENHQRDALKNLHLNKLSELQYREPYIGIINGTDSIEEIIPPDENDSPLTVKEAVGSIEFTCVSGGFETGNVSSVQINGQEYSRNERGLNIVIYNKEDSKVLYSTCFDKFRYSESVGLDLESFYEKQKTSKREPAHAEIYDELNQYSRIVGNEKTNRYWSSVKDKEEGMLSYLQSWLTNTDNTIILSVMGESSNKLSEESRRSIKEMGLSALSNIQYRDSYIGVIENGNVLFEKKDHNTVPIRYDKDGLRILSGGFDSGNTASIEINGEEYSKKKSGINIVVYDRTLEKVVSSEVFDTCQFPALYVD
ncbi:MAG: hypothetical protein IJ088_07840 [Clostridia bacterium]|nr:hypothetical protein [Clostridia bacterium]